MDGLTMKTPKKKITPQQSAEADVPGTRASGKDHRRARLIRAARDLIAERKDGNFSMQELATRAGLSLATPYNLLGSKAAILQGVYRAETEGFRTYSKTTQRKSPAERVMATVEHALKVFARNPQFYRNLSRSLRELGQNDMRQLIVPLSDAMLQPLVEELIAAGAITVAVSPTVITTHLHRIFESTFLHWAALDWDEATFRSELRSGFALAFLGLFEGKNRAALLAELNTVAARRHEDR
jgi:AcrR family transcriptional regulator